MKRDVRLCLRGTGGGQAHDGGMGKGVERGNRQGER